jgi:hypothetical protein
VLVVVLSHVVADEWVAEDELAGLAGPLVAVPAAREFKTQTSLPAAPTSGLSPLD